MWGAGCGVKDLRSTGLDQLPVPCFICIVHLALSLPLVLRSASNHISLGCCARLRCLSPKAAVTAMRESGAAEPRKSAAMVETFAVAWACGKEPGGVVLSPMQSLHLQAWGVSRRYPVANAMRAGQRGQSSAVISPA